MEPTSQLRLLLASALRAEGLGRLCRGEGREYSDWASRFSYVLMGGFYLGFVACIADWVDANLVATAGIAVASIVLLGGGGMKIGVPAAASLLVGTWAVFSVVQLQASDHDFLETVVVPFLLTGFGVATVRTRRLLVIGRSASLLLPIALTVLLIPLFTADLWQAVSLLTLWNLVALIGLAIVPLLVAVALQVRRRVPDAVEQAAGSRSREGMHEFVLDRIVRLLPDEERDASKRQLHAPLKRLVDSGDLAAATDEVVKPMRRQAVRALMTAVVGSTCTAAIYLWLLAWVLVPIPTAESWIGTNVQAHEFDLLFVSFWAPTEPYALVALLLGVAATAVMLGSAAAEEGFERRLVDALLRHPARDAVAMALAYRQLRAEEGSIARP